MSYLCRQVISILLLLIFTSQLVTAMAMPCKAQHKTQASSVHPVNITKSSTPAAEHINHNSMHGYGSVNMTRLELSQSQSLSSHQTLDQDCCKTPGQCFAGICAHVLISTNPALMINLVAIPAAPDAASPLPIPPKTSLYRPPILV